MALDLSQFSPLSPKQSSTPGSAVTTHTSPGWKTYVPDYTVTIEGISPDETTTDIHGVPDDGCEIILYTSEEVDGEYVERRFPNKYDVYIQRSKNIGYASRKDVPGFHRRHDRVLGGEIVFKPYYNDTEAQGEITATEKAMVNIEERITFLHPTEIRLQLVADMLNDAIRKDKRRYLAACPTFVAVEGDECWELKLDLED